jgi:hypothetical protein
VREGVRGEGSVCVISYQRVNSVSGVLVECY